MAKVIKYGGAQLYPKQRAAIYDEARISLIAASTKSGKTIGCLSWLLEQALTHGRRGRDFWWVAPVFAQAFIGFERMRDRLPKGLYKQNQSIPSLTLANGARIVFKSGERVDDLYGQDVYAAVLDEASRMREGAWLAIRSTISHTEGPVRIIGNVVGRKNWFYTLCAQAEQGAEGMAFHRITCWDAVEAGVLKREEIEASRLDFERLGRLGAWQQLYMAEASDESENPFGIAAIENCLLPDVPKPQIDSDGNFSWDHPEGLLPLVAGVDLAGRGAQNVNPSAETTDRDYTAIVEWDPDGTCAHMERFRKTHTETQKRLVKVLGRTSALVDSTGTGDMMVETMQRRGDMRVEGFTFTQRSRQDLLEGLALAIQGEGIRFPDGPLRDELESFEYVYKPSGVSWCVAPQMRVLRSDLRWIAADSIRTGDSLLAFDESPVFGRKARRWRISRVLETRELERPSYKLTMADGTELISSEEHLWLTEISPAPEWRRTDELRGKHPTSQSKNAVPNRLLRLLDTWQDDLSRESGYLAAAFDGEGCVSQVLKHNGDNYATRLTFTQRDNEMLALVKMHLQRFGFTWQEFVRDNGVRTLQLRGKRPEVVRFFGQIRPVRLAPRFDLEKLGIMNKMPVPVVTVEPLGERPVISITTTTRTFVCEGFASHNCVPPGFHDDLTFAAALAVKKLPWKRRVSPPESVGGGGSRWAGADGQAPTDPLKSPGGAPSALPAAAGVPMLVTAPGGGSRWTAADR